MKSLKKLLLVIMASTIMFTQSGCFGSFELTKAVYEANQNVGDKVVNELVFLVFIIIPVYPVATFVDAIVLNSIEFWSGTNPLAMNEGDVETQEVKSGDKLYQITATQNKFNIEQLEGPDAGKDLDIVYNPSTQIWSIHAENNDIEIMQVLGDKKAKIFQPFGMSSTIDLSNLNNEMLLKNI